VAEATSGTALPTTLGPQVADEVAAPAAAVPRGATAAQHQYLYVLAHVTARQQNKEF
jgi:hypothetical protein